MTTIDTLEELEQRVFAARANAENIEGQYVRAMFQYMATALVKPTALWWEEEGRHRFKPGTYQ